MRTSSIAWATVAVAFGTLHGAPPASAQTVQWKVVAGEDSRVVSPGLPADGRNITDIWIGDAGRDQFGIRIFSPSSAAGYWSYRNGQFVRYTALNTTGARGPNRSGADANHVFLVIDTGWGSAAPDGQRNFLGRAGDPAATQLASYGIWRWNGSTNVEVARASVDGVLGPGLGAGWVFPNNGYFGQGRPLNGGRMLINADVTSPTGASSQFVAMHRPGEGNKPCLRTGTSEPALAPGLTPGDTFQTFSAGLDRLAVNRAGAIYGRLFASNSREGLFELCNGSPRVVATDEEIGPRGPAIGSATAVFSTFHDKPQPAAYRDELIYFADWREPSQSSRTGLFHHDGTANRGIVYNEPSGYYGPNWAGSTWRVFDTGTLSVAGNWAAFSAGVYTEDGGNPVGLWRVHAGDRPELVALINLVGAPYEPEPGRTWRSFNAVAMLGNGDIVVDATTNPNSTHDLWLLRPGQAPRRLLSEGQSIQVPTAQGMVSAPISSFGVPSYGADYSVGRDSWIGADGTILLPVNVTSYGRVLITTWLDAPDPEVIFDRGDFE